LVTDKFVEFMDAFCERECAKFTTASAGGYTLEQTAVHEQYKRIYESRIESHLRKHGVSQQAFMQALLDEEERASAGSEDAALAAAQSEAASIGVELRAPMPVLPPTLIASLLHVENFEEFATMMQQRALEQE
jgi:hypothetical protein